MVNLFMRSHFHFVFKRLILLLHVVPINTKLITSFTEALQRWGVVTVALIEVTVRRTLKDERDREYGEYACCLKGRGCAEAEGQKTASHCDEFWCSLTPF